MKEAREVYASYRKGELTCEQAALKLRELKGE
jgi:hypothetical protein